MKPWIRACKRSLCGDEYIRINVTQINRDATPYMWLAAIVMAAVVFRFLSEGQ